MKKQIIILFLLCIILMPGFSAEHAVIKEAAGKVEIMAPGENWQPAKKGTVLVKGTTISTGFRSTAVLDLGSSVLEVKPLTRMKLEELIKTQNKTTTKLYLRVGRVRAEVKSGTGTRHDFKLRSPVSTAAVRGTKFEYNGRTLKVEEGTVSYFNRLGQSRRIGAGERSKIDGFTAPQQGVKGKQSLSGVLPPGFDLEGFIAGFSLFNPDTWSLPEIPFTDITITVDWE